MGHGLILLAAMFQIFEVVVMSSSLNEQKVLQALKGRRDRILAQAEYVIPLWFTTYIANI